MRLCPSFERFSDLNILTELLLISGTEAFEAAISAVSKYGGASAGYRTLLDALIPALAVLKEVI